MYKLPVLNKHLTGAWVTDMDSICMDNENNIDSS